MVLQRLLPIGKHDYLTILLYDLQYKKQKMRTIRGLAISGCLPSAFSTVSFIPIAGPKTNVIVYRNVLQESLNLPVANFILHHQQRL